MTRVRRRQQLALWRLGAWGSVAAVALAAVALASQTDNGARRIDMALNGIDEPNVNAALLAVADQRAAQAEAETRRLAGVVRELSADRDRLNARIAGLERNVEDMTGSIARQTAAAADAKKPAPPPTPAPAQAVPPTPIPAEKPAAAVPIDKPEAVPAIPPEKPPAEVPVKEPAPSAASEVKTSAAPAAARTPAHADMGGPAPIAVAIREVAVIDPLGMPGMDAKVAAWPGEDEQKQAAAPPTQAAPLPPPTEVPLASARNPAAPPAPPQMIVQRPGKPEYAVEVGGTTSVEAARARWTEIKANYGPLVGRLEPAVMVDRRFRASFRLLLGPLPNYSAALQLCGQFATHHVSCRAVHYAGERLAQH